MTNCVPQVALVIPQLQQVRVCPNTGFSCRYGVDREVEQKTSKADILQDTLKIDEKH